MSNSALTIPGRWSSFNNSTVHHLNKTRQASFRGLRSDRSRSSISQEHATNDGAEDDKVISVYTKDNRLWFKSGKTNESTNTIKGASGFDELPKLIENHPTGYQNASGTNLIKIAKDPVIKGARKTKGSTLEISDILNEYKVKIKRLETEKNGMLKQINALYSENKSLKLTLESMDESGLDSYRQVLEDRKVLREAEDNYKKRIAKLEKEIKEMQKAIESINEENRKLKEKSLRLEDQFETQSKYHNIYWKWNELRKENEKLQKDLDAWKSGGSNTHTHIMFGRTKQLDFLADYQTTKVKHGATDGQLMHVAKYHNIYEERNALKAENSKLKQENVKMLNQISKLRDAVEPQAVDKTVQLTDMKTDARQKLYADSAKKAWLYQRISELEHEVTYLTISNRNLLSEVNDLQTKYRNFSS